MASLTIADNADNTGATATITGSGGGANQVYVQNVDGQLGSGSWTLDRLGRHTAGVEQRLIDAEDEAEEDARVAKRQASASADADRIDKHFASDQEVAWLVMCLREEKAPSKARIAAGLTQTQYETIRKRMRRGLEKLFPGRSAR